MEGTALLGFMAFVFMVPPLIIALIVALSAAKK